MVWHGLERNRLDYILTDLLPVELTELFSFKEFYDFLNEKENRNTLSNIVDITKKNKAINSKAIFVGGWDTQPLKYSIMKGSNSIRRMSLVQPLSAINIYIFIEVYQRDILNFLDKNHHFSLRYHKKCTDLYYKGKTDKAIDYFHEQSTQNGKLAIQQLGTFFKTVPFASINEFTSSLKWRLDNFHFPYYAQIDYKSCFDSIYSHSYKWIITRNTVDSKNLQSSSLFVTIDRLLQNINGKSSNGLIVGPEFSRMIAEILLQHIDNEVKLDLEKEGIFQSIDYVAYRYVDDIYIFGQSQNIVEKVILSFSKISQKSLLQLNELKISKGETPCLPKEWLTKTREISGSLGNWFYSQSEYEKQVESDKHLVKKGFVFIDKIKDDISVLIKAHEPAKRTVVSFLLSTLFHKISIKKEGYTLFGARTHGRPLMLLDMAFFIYAFFPSYEQTRKLISIIVYINDELNFKNDQLTKRKLKNLFSRYDFIFNHTNIFDLIDWFAFLSDYGIALDIKIENTLIRKAQELNDPIVWANLLLYSKYNDTLFQEVKKLSEQIISTNLVKITEGSKMLNEEFWYVLVFHNCPFISPSIILLINSIIQGIKPSSLDKPSNQAINLIHKFLEIKESSGTKPLKSFFNWSGSDGIGQKITYRTHQRTIFKKYNRRNGFYTSLDWVFRFMRNRNKNTRTRSITSLQTKNQSFNYLNILLSRSK